MSNPLDPRFQDPMPPVPPPPGDKRPVILSILMFLFGLVLLLPGVCAVIFAGVAFSGSSSGADQFLLLWLICMAISAGGIALIVKAFR